MKIERYSSGRVHRPARRTWSWLLLAGAALTLCICTLMLVVAVPRIALQMVGLNPVGATDDLFIGQTPPPTPVLQNIGTAPQIVVDLGSYGSRTFSADVDTYQFFVGSEAASGQQVAVASFTEAGLLALCQQYSVYCGTSDSRIRSATFDLRPNGAVVYADVFIDQLGIWQRVGLVLRVMDRTELVVSGVDIGGTLYTAPPGWLSQQVTEAQQIINSALDQLVVQAAGAHYRLTDISLTDSVLTLTMR